MLRDSIQQIEKSNHKIKHELEKENHSMRKQWNHLFQFIKKLDSDKCVSKLQKFYSRDYVA